jgi:hypothetical protein
MGRLLGWTALVQVCECAEEPIKNWTEVRRERKDGGRAGTTVVKEMW